MIFTHTRNPTPTPTLNQMSSFPNPSLETKDSRSPCFENQLHEVRQLTIYAKQGLGNKL